jgi:hypothetical protein
MTVIAFRPRPRQQLGGWRPAELEAIVDRLAQERAWEVGMTELGDPQFYLLGPPPQVECLLCISRLGATYVVEDGAGRVLLEHNSLVVLAEQARALLQKKRTQVAARIALIWCALREACEARFEAVVGESEELLAHFAPQLAALA